MIRPSIISRYLIKEIVITLAGVATVLFLIFISGQLVTLYGMAASGNLQVKSILIALGLQSIANMVFVLPLSFYLAILLAFSRLYRDNEMVVLQACGISQWRVLRSVMLLAVLFSLLVSYLSLYLVPWAESETELVYKKSEQRGTLESLSSGRFKELPKGEGVVYVQEYDSKALRMKKIFVQNRYKQQDAVITAASGYRRFDDKTGDQFLILEDGYRYDAQTKTTQAAVIQFERHGVRIDEEQAKPLGELRQRSMPTVELLKRGSGPDQAEFQWRVSTALFCVVLAMLGIPLSRTSPRQGRYAKLALALLIYIIYTNLLNVSRAWLNKNAIDVWIGMWWVHLLGLLVALSFFVQWKQLFRRIWHTRVR